MRRIHAGHLCAKRPLIDGPARATANRAFEKFPVERGMKPSRDKARKARLPIPSVCSSRVTVLRRAESRAVSMEMDRGDPEKAYNQD